MVSIKQITLSAIMTLLASGAMAQTSFEEIWTATAAAFPTRQAPLSTPSVSLRK